MPILQQTLSWNCKYACHFKQFGSVPPGKRLGQENFNPTQRTKMLCSRFVDASALEAASNFILAPYTNISPSVVGMETPLGLFAQAIWVLCATPPSCSPLSI